MHTIRGHRFAVALLAGGFIVACGVGFSELAAGDAAVKRQPLSPHYASTAAPFKKLEVGEDCTAFEGNSGCETDLCLRVAPGIPSRGFCSIKCAPGDDGSCPDAPASWQCRQIFPSSDGWVCAPPNTHKSGKATRRGKKVEAPARTVVPILLLSSHADGGSAP